MLTCTMATCKKAPVMVAIPGGPTSITIPRGPGHAIATVAAVLDHDRQWLQMLPFRAAKTAAKGRTVGGSPPGPARHQSETW